MWTGMELPLAQWNILSCVSLGSKGTFHRAWKWSALRRTRRVSSVSDPGSKNSGMAPSVTKRRGQCFLKRQWKWKAHNISRHVGNVRNAVAVSKVITCSVVWDPWVDDADSLLRFCEVNLVRIGLEGLGQCATVSLLQAHLPFHHYTTGCFNAVLTGHVPLQETLLPRHPPLCGKDQSEYPSLMMDVYLFTPVVMCFGFSLASTKYCSKTAEPLDGNVIQLLDMVKYWWSALLDVYSIDVLMKYSPVKTSLFRFFFQFLFFALFLFFHAICLGSMDHLPSREKPIADVRALRVFPAAPSWAMAKTEATPYGDNTTFLSTELWASCEKTFRPKSVCLSCRELCPTLLRASNTIM